MSGANASGCTTSSCCCERNWRRLRRKCTWSTFQTAVSHSYCGEINSLPLRSHSDVRIFFQHRTAHVTHNREHGGLRYGGGQRLRSERDFSSRHSVLRHLSKSGESLSAASSSSSWYSASFGFTSAIQIPRSFAERTRFFGPAECSPNQGRVDGCQLRSGRGSMTYTSGKSRSRTERWPTSPERRCVWGEAPHIATLKVGGGLGAAPPCSGIVIGLSELTWLRTESDCRRCLIACNTRQFDEVASSWG